MVSHWPIRRKLTIGVVALVAVLTALAVSGFHGVYSYRGLVKAISYRATELPMATQLARQISDMRLTISRVRQMSEPRPGLDIDERPWPHDIQLLRDEFCHGLAHVRETVYQYEDQLLRIRREELAPSQIYDTRAERDKLGQIKTSLSSLEPLTQDGWIVGSLDIDRIEQELENLHALSAELPGYLQQRMMILTDDVRVRYRAWIVVTWVSVILAAIVLSVLCILFYVWIFRPLDILIVDSQRIAGGDFHHRIRLPSRDEMAHLAETMNHMTVRFQEICEDLDNKVRQRTKEVLRSEQLASVGFLAAGVAHEINNPLASIALCAESLEDRLRDLIPTVDDDRDEANSEEIAIVRNYMRMIQEEAFRCKSITERLLDFSRLGDMTTQQTNMSELVAGVIAMVRHIGKYKEKKIVYNDNSSLLADVNPQELKQVVLNLLTNSLDSLSPGGTVWVSLLQRDGQIVLEVRDNGCGMSPEVLEHLFEPFFTRGKEGQGTGLGLSISYRIIDGHGGKITAASDGPGKGSCMTVVFPAQRLSIKESHHRYQAA